MPIRPKKQRFLNGILLEDNLYPDPRKRPGYFQYHRPDGSKKTFQAGSVEAANTRAAEANANRDIYLPKKISVPRRSQTLFHVEEFLAYREHLSPGLKARRSWDNRRYALKLFARADFVELNQITMEALRIWWDKLTHSQQKLRNAEFRRLFNWMMGNGLLPKLKFNPFTSDDSVPKLLLKEKSQKKRPPCTESDYWDIYNRAPHYGYQALQVAMGISRYTSLREADVCALRFDRNIDGRLFRAVVSKSDAQKGTVRAARLEWDLDDHPVLNKLIQMARELSLKNRRCPYIVSHNPKRRKYSRKREHFAQVLPRRLYDMFIEVRNSCGIEGVVFHEVRGLASTELKRKGYTLEEIRDVMGHESVTTTAGYINAEDLPYERVHLKLDY